MSEKKLTLIKNVFIIHEYIKDLPKQFFGDYKIPFYEKEHLIFKLIFINFIALVFFLLVSITAIVVLFYQYSVHEYPSIILIKIDYLLSYAPYVIISMFSLFIGLIYLFINSLRKEVCEEMIEWINIFIEQTGKYQEVKLPINKKDGLIWIKIGYLESFNMQINLPTSLEIFR